MASCATALGMQADEIGAVFQRWNEGPLGSFLIEITGQTAQIADPETGKPLLDVIQDKAGQKGTGRWSVIEAQHLAAPASTIEAAVVARNISSRKDAREEMEALFGAAPTELGDALGDPQHHSERTRAGADCGQDRLLCARL